MPYHANTEADSIIRHIRNFWSTQQRGNDITKQLGAQKKMDGLSENASNNNYGTEAQGSPHNNCNTMLTTLVGKLGN